MCTEYGANIGDLMASYHMKPICKALNVTVVLNKAESSEEERILKYERYLCQMYKCNEINNGSKLKSRVYSFVVL